MAVEFLPERLNRPPVVFRGLTSAEMFMSFFRRCLRDWAGHRDLHPVGLLGGDSHSNTVGGFSLCLFRRQSAGDQEAWPGSDVALPISAGPPDPLFVCLFFRGPWCS